MLHALHAELHPDAPALVDDAGTLSWREADQAINRFANALAGELGLRRGDGVVLALENRAEYLLAWFACLRLGARVLHAGGHVTVEELAHFCERGGAKVALASVLTLEAVRAVAAVRQLRVVTCGVDAGPSEVEWAPLLARASDAVPARLSSTGESVVFTSGTTGAAKGAVRDFAAFGPVELSRVLERLPFQAGDRHLVVGPLHHSAPQVFSLLVTALGGTLVLVPKFDARDVNARLVRVRIDTVFLVPTMVRRLLDQPVSSSGRLRAVVVGSSEFSEPLRRAAMARYGVEAVFDFYGATELGWVTLIRGDEMLAHPGSVGRPLAGQQVRIVDGAGRGCAPREVGLIEVKNAQTMVGYANDERATAEAVRGGWCTVEDTGFLDEAGYLHLAGRARDMVKSGGVNVYPAEVERVLAEDPVVRELAVIGVRDPEWGEKLVAVVVLREGAVFDADALRARAKARLSAAKVPREWHVVDALPRNANGKVLKTQLRERFG
jgi:fatty-acyl-CoA synthase